MVGPAIEGEGMIPFAAITSRWFMRRAWLAALWAYPRGIISLETFLRIDDAYYARCVRSHHR